MSADVTGAPPGGDVTAAYCPVCSPVYAGAHQYQRYATPLSSLNSAYGRRPDLDVFRAGGHGPDLLGPLPDTSRAPVSGSTAAAALRAVSCSAPDLIELSSRLPVDEEPSRDDDDGRQVQGVTSFPARHVSQSTVVVCDQSPSRRRRRTMNHEQ